MKKSMSRKSRHYSNIYSNCPNNNQNIKQISYMPILWIFRNCCEFCTEITVLCTAVICYGYPCITSSASFPWLDSSRGQLYVLEYSNNKCYNGSDVKLLSSFSWLISCRTFDNVSLNEFIVNMSAGSWTWVLILQQQRKGNWDKNFVRNNILLSFPILWNLHGNVMHFGKETKTNVLHLYFFFFFNWTTAVEYRRKKLNNII
jgi:hypothetical protein